jgi:hypothetical protein
MRWAEHVVRIRRRDVHTGFWVGNLRERARQRERVRVPVKKKIWGLHSEGEMEKKIIIIIMFMKG